MRLSRGRGRPAVRDEEIDAAKGGWLMVQQFIALCTSILMPCAGNYAT